MTERLVPHSSATGVLLISFLQENKHGCVPLQRNILECWGSRLRHNLQITNQSKKEIVMRSRYIFAGFLVFCFVLLLSGGKSSAQNDVMM